MRRIAHKDIFYFWQREALAEQQTVLCRNFAIAAAWVVSHDFMSLNRLLRKAFRIYIELYAIWGCAVRRRRCRPSCCTPAKRLVFVDAFFKNAQ